jgi:hypothetical protein
MNSFVLGQRGHVQGCAERYQALEKEVLFFTNLTPPLILALCANFYAKITQNGFKKKKNFIMSL